MALCYSRAVWWGNHIPQGRVLSGIKTARDGPKFRRPTRLAVTGPLVEILRRDPRGRSGRSPGIAKAGSALPGVMVTGAGRRYPSELCGWTSW
jgi:hypothetical protein